MILQLPKPMRHAKLSWWHLFLLGLGLLTSSIITFVIWQPITVLPRIMLAPGFSLVDATGTAVNNESFRGGVTLYSFTYTDCVDCPQTPTDIAAVHTVLNEQLEPDVPVKLVTISLNPLVDTPEQLAETAVVSTQPAADPIDWLWLTGTEQRIRYTVGGGFELYYKTEADGNVAFEPRYVLVDALGVIRAWYFTAVPDPNLLLRDVNLLLQEAENADGNQKLLYEAAHLFLCYPR